MPRSGQTPVQEVTDSRVVRALAHPLRVAALALLDEQVLSPKELADELDVSLPLASYHVRRLHQLDLIELVQTRQRRGALQHYYRAKARPKITDATWAQVPVIVKHEMVSAALAQAHTAMAQAAEEGGFDRDDAHASRTSFRTDERGWKELTKLMMKTLERVEEIRERATERIEADHELESRRVTALIMLFEGPEASIPLPPADADGHRSRRKSQRAVAAS
jgi:DNA-binding transcriptional ArsR family regulator